MTRSTSRLYLSAIALLVLALIYVLHSYQQILKTEIGFLYHPETDRIYEVELSAWVGNEPLVRILMPWREVHYGVTGIGEYLGVLSDILVQIEEDRALKEADSRLWVARRGEAARVSLEEFLDQGLSEWDLSYLDITYLIRTDIDKSDQLINRLPAITNYGFSARKYLLTVDAFLATKNTDSNEHEVETLTRALLIRGPSAAYLRHLGVNDPLYTNVNP